ncbi:hypothetical protein D9M71_782160 [compost metagenome]
MHAIQLSNNPTEPLRKGARLSIARDQLYQFRYTTAPTSHALCGHEEHVTTIAGLSRLDADCNLAKRIRKSGRYLHAVIDVRRVK